MTDQTSSSSGPDRPSKDGAEPWAEPGGVPSYVLADAEPERRSAAAETLSALVTAVAVGVLGAGLGLLWLWLAPRVPLFGDGKAVYLKDPEGEEAVGADGVFVLLALGFGVVTGLLVFLRSRRGRIALVLGLAAGAVLGSVLAWRLGVHLGPGSDVAARAKAAGPGKVFDGPLKLQAKGALLAWPVAALATHLGLMGLFGVRDPDPHTELLEPGSPYAR